MIKSKWIKEKDCSLTYRCPSCRKFIYSREKEYDEKFEDLSRLDAYAYCPRCGENMKILDEPFTFDEIPLHSVFKIDGTDDKFIKLLNSDSPSNCIRLRDCHHFTLVDKAKVVIIKERK